MINYSKIFRENLYDLNSSQKEHFFFKNLSKLNDYHYKNCPEFKTLANHLFNKKKCKQVTCHLFMLKCSRKIILNLYQVI